MTTVLDYYFAIAIYIILAVMVKVTYLYIKDVTRKV